MNRPIVSAAREREPEQVAMMPRGERPQGCTAPERWPVGTYRGWAVSRVPVPTGPPPQYATESDRGFPWLAERGEQWVCADSYDWLLKAIDDEMAAGAA